MLMNERVRAILIAALKLSPQERQELAQSLMGLGADPALADQLAAEERASGGAPEEAPQQPTSDVLAKYLDV
jgi:hypothetical protein